MKIDFDAISARVKREDMTEDQINWMYDVVDAAIASSLVMWARKGFECKRDAWYIRTFYRDALRLHWLLYGPGIIHPQPKVRPSHEPSEVDEWQYREQEGREREIAEQACGPVRSWWGNR